MTGSVPHTTGRGRRRGGRTEAVDELRALAGRRADRAVDALLRAAAAFREDREREALSVLRPLAQSYPDAAGVRELLGLVHYRLGHWRAATRELEAFAALSASTDQHPVLMDCARAQRRWRRVDELWRELKDASPSAEVVIEGRIVAAGSLADRGDLDAAIQLLGRRSERVPRVRTHHLRAWYALADLEERAGNVPRARALFARVAEHDPDFADVAARLAALR